MKIEKDPLTKEVLLGNIASDEPVYTESEMEALKLYMNSNNRLGINQTIFNLIIRNDISVFRGKNLEQLAKEKTDKINPILGKLGIEAILIGENPVHTLYQVKIKGFCALKMTTPLHFEDNHPELLLREKESDEFPRERAELCEMFGDPGLPILVYGSCFEKRGYAIDTDTRDKATDIDTMVFPSTFDEGFYQRLSGQIDPQRKPELSFLIVPKDFAYYFALSDAGNKLTPGESLMINGELYFPSLDEKYIKRLRVHGALSDYMRIRNALTHDGIQNCQSITQRINSYLKAPKFIHKGLALNSDEPQIMPFEHLPSKFELVTALVNANLQAYKILLAYQNK